MVEHETVDLGVPGSIPGVRTFYNQMMARLLRGFSQVRTNIVPLYESNDYAALAAIKGDFIRNAKKVMGKKYLEFVPFHIESFFTRPKKFILKLDFDPEAKQFHLVSLQLGLLDQQTIDLEELIPTTFVEYESSHYTGKLIEPADWHDLEMIYVNKRTNVFYVFDKQGSWKEEGVSHPMLAWEERFREFEWMDVGRSGSSDCSGGAVKPTF
mmetsp:Transcript_1934/g.4292  ORF Transcript_1934/g.4292 Transcript_1934/m.4292 type:complete len:211 (+) Transcript_1934:1810-2442(+)